MICRRATRDEILALRHAELRPGLPIESAWFEGDDDAATFHFGAFDEHGECIGCASFMLNRWDGEPAYQLRGMAARCDRLKQGIGAALLAYALDTLRRETKVRIVWGNARAHAAGFYQKQGWRIASELFDIPTVGPHYKVMRRVSP